MKKSLPYNAGLFYLTSVGRGGLILYLYITDFNAIKNHRLDYVRRIGYYKDDLVISKILGQSIEKYKGLEEEEFRLPFN